MVEARRARAVVEAGWARAVVEARRAQVHLVSYCNSSWFILYTAQCMRSVYAAYTQRMRSVCATYAHVYTIQYVYNTVLQYSSKH